MTVADPPAPRHSRRGLYVPLILFVLVAAGWTAWWFVLAGQVETRLDAQVARLTESGWRIEQRGRAVSGWPFRVRVGYRDFTAQAPSGQGAAIPELVAEANAWDPSHWVLVAPQGLTLDRAGKGPVVVTGDALRASVSGLTQRYPDVAVELVNPVFVPVSGAETFPLSRAGRIEAYLRPHAATTQPAPPDAVDVLFRLIDAEGRPQGPVEGMAQSGRLTLQVEAVVEQASRLSDPTAQGVFAGWSGAGGRLTRVRGEIEAGPSRATLASEALTTDAEGRLVGEVTLQATRPMAAIAGLARSGSGAVNRMGAAGAAAASAATGDRDTALTLQFRDGRTYLGPFTLAPAPRLF